MKLVKTTFLSCGIQTAEDSLLFLLQRDFIYLSLKKPQKVEYYFSDGSVGTSAISCCVSMSVMPSYIGIWHQP